MSNRSNYIKKFIIFKNRYSNMKELKSKGHGKLELKGNNLNVSLSIKGAEANNFYNVDLIKRREAYTIGKVYTKEDKSGEREISVNYRELEKNGFPLEEVDGIILSRNADVLFGESLKGTGKSLDAYIEQLEREEARPPQEESILVEYIEENLEEDLEEDIEDIEYIEDIEDEISIEYIEDREAIEEVEAVDEIANEIEIPVQEEQPLEQEAQEIENIEYIQEITEEDAEKIHLEQVGKLSTEGEFEEAEPEPTEVAPKVSVEAEGMFSQKAYEEIMEEIFNIPELGYENQFDLDGEDINNKNKIEADKMSEYVKNILNFFPHSEPFTMTLEGYDWWKIDMEEIDGDKSFLPYFSYIIGGNNKSNRFEEGVDPKDLLNRYGHYLFGLYNEGEGVKFYMYGIPGTFSLEDYPRGSVGFNTWFEGVEVPGYWVIYIEPETGKILYPINPMIPKA